MLQLGEGGQLLLVDAGEALGFGGEGVKVADDFKLRIRSHEWDSEASKNLQRNRFLSSARSAILCLIKYRFCLEGIKKPLAHHPLLWSDESDVALKTKFVVKVNQDGNSERSGDGVK